MNLTPTFLPEEEAVAVIEATEAAAIEAAIEATEAIEAAIEAIEVAGEAVIDMEEVTVGEDGAGAGAGHTMESPSSQTHQENPNKKLHRSKHTTTIYSKTS